MTITKATKPIRVSAHYSRPCLFFSMPGPRNAGADTGVWADARPCCAGQSAHPSPPLTLGSCEVRDVRLESKPRSVLARAWSRTHAGIGVNNLARGYDEAERRPSVCSCVPEERRSGWGAEGAGKGTTTSSSVTPSASASESVRSIKTLRSECCRLGPGSSDVVALAPLSARGVGSAAAYARGPCTPVAGSSQLKPYWRSCVCVSSTM